MTTQPTATPAAEFTGLRGVLWPIHGFEMKKFLPMGLMMLCILFNYTVLRDTKDALVVLAPAGGAETISFLKLYGVTPSAILFMVLFINLANRLSREALFHSIISFFLVFFGAFAFVIYPNREMFHMGLETMKALQATYPTFHWFIPVIGNWSFSLFYILSELWGSVVLSALFWQFANQITKVSEAKRFYGLFGMVGNFGLVLSGSLLVLGSEFAKTAAAGVDAWGFNLKLQMSLVILAGLITLGLYSWMNRCVLTDPRLYDPNQDGGGKKKNKPKLSLGESLKYLMTSRYLLLIAVIVLAYGVSINLVEGVWKGQIKIAFPNENDYLAFMGKFSFTTGIVTIFMMVVGNNVLRRLSWLTGALVTPIMILVTSVLFFSFIYYSNQGSPFDSFMGTTYTLVMVAVLVGLFQNVLSKATKYSLFDSTKQMAYIPLDDELKTKGQAAVEVIGGRGGKSGGAAIQSVLLMIVGGGASLSSLIFILGPTVILICLLWVVASMGISKRFAEMTKTDKETKTAA